MSADPITDDVVALLARIVDRFVGSYESAAAAQGLTAVQAKVLGALREPLPMHRIAEKLNSERSNVTGIIDRLEARGLVERRSDSRDRRGKKNLAPPARAPPPPDRRARRDKNLGPPPAGALPARDFQRALGFAAEPLAALGPDDRVKLRDL